MDQGPGVGFPNSEDTAQTAFRAIIGPVSDNEYAPCKYFKQIVKPARLLFISAMHINLPYSRCVPSWQNLNADFFLA